MVWTGWITPTCRALATVTLVAAALHDLAVRTVPNAFAAMLGLAGLGLAAADHRLPGSLAAAGAVLAVATALWLRGLMGGADAKLLGAAGLVVGPAHAGAMLLAVALAGGLLSLPYAAGPRVWGAGAAAPASPASPRHAPVLRRLIRCERRRLRRRGPLPYAVAIAAGVLAVLLQEV